MTAQSESYESLKVEAEVTFQQEKDALQTKIN